jgi:serine-type D-Ala-D-Ala carboxypeptidase/endopeptidase (penicillin-binding protein 4)
VLGSTAPGGLRLINQLRTGEPGSGDNAYIYLPPYSKVGLMQGTVPAGNASFQISGSLPDPALWVGHLLDSCFQIHHLHVDQSFLPASSSLDSDLEAPVSQTLIYSHWSPPLDSINYWFLKKSINLYGEALVKTIAFEKTGVGDTDSGVRLVQAFWASHGIEASAIHLIDGSGLSPQNRVTAKSLVDALRYAKTRQWFSSFYDALPEINGMKMKSGSIGGVRSYAGYQTSRGGTQYIFALLVNNFDGPASDLVREMWIVLNQLK